MAFLLNSQAQGVSGKNEQSTQTPCCGAPEARGPMPLHRRKAGPDCRNYYACAVLSRNLAQQNTSWERPV